MTDSSIRLVQHCSSKECYNPLSGHRWAEIKLLQRWSLHTRIGAVREFKDYDKAVRVMEEYKAFDAKFPLEMPRSEREINKAKRLGLEIT